MIVKNSTRYSWTAQGLLRIAAGLLFMQHGAQKLFGVLGGFGGQPGATADLFSMMGFAGALEFFGGALLAVGLLTQPVGFLLSGLMASAFFMAHAPQGLWPILNGGELAALFSFVFLFFAASGPGRLSVDGLLWNRGDEPAVPATSGSEALRRAA